jgi:hypothetical protein
MIGEIRGALDQHPREALVEILAYVFKEYVVEGSAPLASGAGAILDARSELDGMTFAQLVTWLQAHLDVPELRLFEVQGERVSVRSGGQRVAIEAAREPEPAVAPAPQMPVTPTPPVQTRPAPSVTPAANNVAPQQGNVAPQQGNVAPQQGTAAPQQKDEKTTSETGSRFSLLDID